MSNLTATQPAPALSPQEIRSLVEGTLKYWAEQRAQLLRQLEEAEYQIAFAEGKLAGVDECLAASGIAVPVQPSFSAPYKTAK